MNTPIFNRSEWIERLISEIGLTGVPYEELDKYFVESGFGFSSAGAPVDNQRQTAREYVDTQLAHTEAAYAELLADHGVFAPSSNVLMENINDQLNEVANMFDSLPTDLQDIYTAVPSLDELNRLQIPYIQTSVNPDNVHCFDILVNNMAFVVAINDDGSDIRTKDQIRHVMNTTFFIERRDKTTIQNHEQVISYYQFINLIEPYIIQSENVTNKILKNVTTTFDGPTVEGF